MNERPQGHRSRKGTKELRCKHVGAAMSRAQSDRKEDREADHEESPTLLRNSDLFFRSGVTEAKDPVTDS